MRKTILRNTLCAAVLAAGLSLVSCKGNEGEAEMDRDAETETLEPMDRDEEEFEEKHLDTVGSINSSTPDKNMGEPIP